MDNKVKEKKEKVLVSEKSNAKKNVFKKQIYVDTPLRIFVFVGFIVIFGFLSLIFLKEGLETKTYSSVNYSESSKLDYRVYLKPNDYFTEPYLEKGKQYIANLIDYIDVDFGYEFSANALMNYNYNYFINADVVVYEKGDSSKVLYQKTDVLLPNKVFNYSQSSAYSFRENLKVDYSYYNNIVTSFKKDYALALESTLTISLHVYTNGATDVVTQPINSYQAMSISIPLTEQTINIGMNYNGVNDKNVVEEYSNVETINIIYFILFGICIIITSIVTVKFVRFLNKIRVKGTEYDRILGAILKDYEGIVARVKKVPDFNGRTLIELESFDEILDISEKLDKPILFIEMHKRQKSWFLLVNQNEIYRYALKLVDVDKASSEKK